VYPDLYAVLGVAQVPDLRDEFIRGASTSNPPLAKEDWMTGKPKTQFVTDSQGAHTHTIAPFTHMGLDSGGATGWSYGVATATVATSSAGAHTHHVVGGGDVETRPRNSRLLYCIRALP
jgi:hypothetical protein